MNTGIGDAVNLAWKLAAVLRRRADGSILESYEPERIAFARRLVATTDQAFTGVTSSGAVARRLRLDVVPRVLPFLFSLPAVRRFMFRTVSQTAINYRGSALSAGREKDLAFLGEAARHRMADSGELLRRLGTVEVAPEVREKARAAIERAFRGAVKASVGIISGG